MVKFMQRKLIDIQIIYMVEAPLAKFMQWNIYTATICSLDKVDQAYIVQFWVCNETEIVGIKMVISWGEEGSSCAAVNLEKASANQMKA